MIPSWYDKYKKFIDSSIENYLNDYLSFDNNLWFDEFREAVIYSSKWGKRIRAILAIEFYLIFSWKNFDDLSIDDDIIKYAIAIELLHSYSLVHDDLPCMDNDTFRRWNLTTWKKYNETIATLVWDMLNTISMEIVSSLWNTRLSNYFSNSVWYKWMLWWQVLDIYYEKFPWRLTLEYLNQIHNQKTWALIDSSIVWWIYLAQSDFDIREDLLKNDLEEFLDNYDDFWYNVWLAFQIKDDLLDVEWTNEETWKSVWDNENKWYVYFLWIEKTKKELNNIIDKLFKKSELLKSEKIDFSIKYIAIRKK